MMKNKIVISIQYLNLSRGVNTTEWIIPPESVKDWFLTKIVEKINETYKTERTEIKTQQALNPFFFPSIK